MIAISETSHSLYKLFCILISFAYCESLPIGSIAFWWNIRWMTDTMRRKLFLAFPICWHCIAVFKTSHSKVLYDRVNNDETEQLFVLTWEWRIDSIHTYCLLRLFMKPSIICDFLPVWIFVEIDIPFDLTMHVIGPTSVRRCFKVEFYRSWFNYEIYPVTGIAWSCHGNVTINYLSMASQAIYLTIIGKWDRSKCTFSGRWYQKLGIGQKRARERYVRSAAPPRQVRMSLSVVDDGYLFACNGENVVALFLHCLHCWFLFLDLCVVQG